MRGSLTVKLGVGDPAIRAPSRDHYGKFGARARETGVLSAA